MLGEPAWSRRERTERFEEFVELTDLLLRSPHASWQGHHYAAHEARTAPGCVQQPRVPFAIAATGPRGMRLAARFAQTWVTTGDRSGDGPADPVTGARIVGEQMRRLDDVCLAAGRDPASLARLVLTGPALDGGLTAPAAFDEVLGRYADAGVTDLVVHWPREQAPYAGDREVFERIFAR
jgi:alkanesulfonate monooxygenase SsuD/methylene tetrahydromethanopterin reductase-like flavin-dependent oxidoreductase (luciferase family)